MTMTLEGSADPCVRIRSANELWERAIDTSSVASATSVEPYEEIVRSETSPEQGAATYASAGPQFDACSVSSTTSERRASLVHLSYPSRTLSDFNRSQSYFCRSFVDTERASPYHGGTTSDVTRTTSYFCRTSADCERGIAARPGDVIERDESALPATTDAVRRYELLVALPVSIAGKTQPTPAIVESGLPPQYDTTQHQPRVLPLSLLSAGETDTATLQMPIAPRGDRRSNKRPFNHEIGCSVDSATLTPVVCKVDVGSSQVGLHCQSSQSVLNFASLSATTSYSTAGQFSTSVTDSYEPWDSDAAYRQSPTLSEEGHFVYVPRQTPIRSIPIFDGSAQIPVSNAYLWSQPVVTHVYPRPESIAVSNLSHVIKPENGRCATSVWLSSQNNLHSCMNYFPSTCTSCPPVVCTSMHSVSQSKASVTSNGSYCSEVAFRIGDKGLFDTDNESPLRSASQLTVVSESPLLGRRFDHSSDVERALYCVNDGSAPSARERCIPYSAVMNNVCTGNPCICPTSCQDGARLDSERVFRSDLARQTVPTAWEQFCARTTQPRQPGSVGQSYNLFGPPGNRLPSSVSVRGSCLPLPDKARLMSSSAPLMNDRWSTMVQPGSEKGTLPENEEVRQRYEEVRQRYEGTLPENEEVRQRYEGTLPVNEKVRQRYEGTLPENEKVRQRYEGTLPANEEVRQRHEEVRHVSEICPNGGRHLHGSALLTDGSAPPRNDNVQRKSVAFGVTTYCRVKISSARQTI